MLKSPLPNGDNSPNTVEMTESSELIPDTALSSRPPTVDIEKQIVERGSNGDKSVTVEDNAHSNDILDMDLSVPILTSEESISDHSPIKAMIKSEPIDNSTDLLLNDDLRLQIEKSIELVVNEFSRNTDCVTENVAGNDEQMENSVDDRITSEIPPVEEESLENLIENSDLASVAENVPCNSNVTSSCTESDADVAELPPKIPNDITVIPLSTSRAISIKSEPRDGTCETDGKFKKLSRESISNSNQNNPIHTKGIRLPSLTNGKHSSLTIVPVTSRSAPVKYTLPDGLPTKTRIRSDSGDFSISTEVTIKKTVPQTSTSNGNPSSLKIIPSTMMDPPKPSCGETNVQTSGHSVRSNSLPNDYLGLPITPPQMFLDQGVKSDSLSSSTACSTFNQKCCTSYKPSGVAPSHSMSDLSCSYQSSACTSKSCTVPLPVPGQTSAALAQCQQSSSLALLPYPAQPSSFCANFNSYAQTPPPVSSPKHLKAPINSLNSCRMSSSSPIPAYTRSREPSYSSPILCDSFAATGILPLENPSFRSTSTCNTPPSSSFRNPASCTLPSPNMGPIAPPPPSHSAPSSQAMFPSCNNQSNSLVLPTSPHHQKSPLNPAYPFRSNFTPSYNSNPPYQRAQCCFSSQIQCFNSACTSNSQQQFSIVQHSTKLSNLKSNSIDSVSSMLQYHTYFKKY